MIILNLLPPIKKQELRLTQLYVTIKNLVILVLLVISIIAITLLATKILLQNHVIKIVEQSTLTTQYAKLFNKDIREFNQKLEIVDMIQKDYIVWTDFFINFTKLVPEDINIETLTLNQDKILLTGLAKTRTGLLAFKDNLENSDLFSEIVAPLENLLTKENIDFTIKADINLEKLRNYGD